MSEESEFYKNAFLNSGGKILPLESFDFSDKKTYLSWMHFWERAFVFL
ncbi:hypothetical protein LEP1GSC043_3852 [Leptospira weilii str. Ecochallenge]|uniref:Uncharacterized protein n=1 Tax=Leptospira weilii str. Ecochallenge TaxID=1049986 RepID=N1U8P6_9LEPT|nr:hypothetical protein LEP1GSC043_3852 [Leptospira weilii str. Ecochallenge]